MPTFDPWPSPKHNLFTKNKKVIIGGAILVFLIGGFFVIKYILSDTIPAVNMVSGTEYISGESGQVIIRLSDNNNEAITNGNCTATVLYPDKTYFMIDAEMIQSTTPGNYYRQFITPTINGIYEETITCKSISKRGTVTTTRISSSFHVSVALNFIVDLSKSEREHYNIIMQRINETYDELLRQFNASSANFDNINASIHQGFEGISEDIHGEFNNTNTLINGSTQLINESNKKLYTNMRDLGNAFTTIFANP